MCADWSQTRQDSAYALPDVTSPQLFYFVTYTEEIAADRIDDCSVRKHVT